MPTVQIWGSVPLQRGLPHLPLHSLPLHLTVFLSITDHTLYPLRASVGNIVARVSPSSLASKLRQDRDRVFLISCHTHRAWDSIWEELCFTSAW